MNIRPSAAIRQIIMRLQICVVRLQNPYFLRKNGEGDLVVMDIETFIVEKKC